MQHLFEQALAPEGGEGNPLYQVALKVEEDEKLGAEMTEWDGIVADGVDADAAPARHG